MSNSTGPADQNCDSFVCGCEANQRWVCQAEKFYGEHKGRSYCVLHYPALSKEAEFEKALQRKIEAKDFSFDGVWFPQGISFKGYVFNSDVSFHKAHFIGGAEFSGVQFRKSASFVGARFYEPSSFSGALFEGACYFGQAWFRKQSFFMNARFNAAADFGGASFESDAVFSDTKFDEGITFKGSGFGSSAMFDGVVFKSPVSFQASMFGRPEELYSEAIPASQGGPRKVNFEGTIFKDSVIFESSPIPKQSFVSFSAAAFEKPERATFHSVRLRPHWFINADTRKLNFINVDWGFIDQRETIKREVATLERYERGYLKHLLEITFRQLAVNAEDNNRYEEAANFRYLSMEIRRLQRWRKVDLFRLSWWYWLLSGYGERVQRAFNALLIIWALFALIYWSGNSTWWQPKQATNQSTEALESERQPHSAAPLAFPEALIYSAGVMALQKPAPLPANKRAKASVLFETILGPIQAALLALAIRRKFMR
jgi:uncharacterized protein YjbI with pentapeptide repeats